VVEVVEVDNTLDDDDYWDDDGVEEEGYSHDDFDDLDE